MKILGMKKIVEIKSVTDAISRNKPIKEWIDKGRTKEASTDRNKEQ